MEELMYIQSKIHAPKDSVNQYGKYKYRKAEQIMEAAKPYLLEKECQLVVTDEIVPIGNFIYLKATSTITNKEGDSVSAVGWAREADSLAGMSPGQVTGATSSYARKYSLCGLFAIDDTKDLDDESITNPKPVQQQPQIKRQAKVAPVKPAQSTIPQMNLSLDDAKKKIADATTKEQLTAIYNGNKNLQTNVDFIGTLTARKNQILNQNGTTTA